MKSINELIWDYETSDDQKEGDAPISANGPGNIGINSCCGGGSGCACFCRSPIPRPPR